jgi:hypothetical protein
MAVEADTAAAAVVAVEAADTEAAVAVVTAEMAAAVEDTEVAADSAVDAEVVAADEVAVEVNKIRNELRDRCSLATSLTKPAKTIWRVCSRKPAKF